MFVAIQTILIVMIGFFFAYLSGLSLLSLVASRRGRILSTHFRMLGIVIPAHNEELTIARTLRSLNATDYPRGSYEMIVVADNCSDRTAEIAASLDATVYERHDDVLRGKGYALRWCFDRLLSRKPGFDALIVIDADTEVAGDFLKVINSCLERGAHVIQSSDLVKPVAGSWSSEITRLGFLLYNYVRPLGRSLIRCSAGLRGNGMCFSTEVLRQVPWEAYSRAEDLEYGLTLLLKGFHVTFAPDAKVLATMPVASSNAETQRARWETGRYPVVRKFAVKLVLAAMKTLSYRFLDALIDLIMPPLVNLLGVVIVMIALNVLFSFLGIGSSLTFAFLWTGIICLGMIHIFVGLIAAGADRSLYMAILQVPRYAIWKLFLYSKLLRKGQSKEWIRTTRERANVYSIAEKDVHH